MLKKIICVLFCSVSLFSCGGSSATDLDFPNRVRTIGEGLVVNNHAYIPYQMGVSIGTVSKTQPLASGGRGMIKFFSDDAPIYPALESYLQGTIALITDPSASMRRLKFECIEQGTGWCNVTLNEQGGKVGVGTNSPQALMHIATPSNSQGYTEALRIDGRDLANNWERGILFTGNDGAVRVGEITAYLNGGDREMRIYVNSTLVFRIRQDGAVVIGNPSGGFMGTGTLNVQGGLYVNGVPH